MWSDKKGFAEKPLKFLTNFCGFLILRYKNFHGFTQENFYFLEFMVDTRKTWNGEKPKIAHIKLT
jgi:hypothetical protein